MSRLILVTGGVRSGKSRYAEDRLQNSPRVLYIATARCFDGEMERRIQIHKERRPAGWTTAEATRDLDQVLTDQPEGDVLLDCVTNMVTNLMLDAEPDYDHLPMSRIEEIEAAIGEEFTRMLDVLKGQERTAVLVSGEVGLGLVAPYRMGRVFTDILGRLNQRLAAEADEVYFLACGIPLKLK